MNAKIFFFLLLALLSFVSNSETKPSVNCNVGPITKNFGGVSWLVYSCGDDKNIAIVSAPDSPAMPFYFFFQDGKLYGEGTGSKTHTDAAHEEIKKLTAEQISALIKETKQDKK